MFDNQYDYKNYEGSFPFKNIKEKLYKRKKWEKLLNIVKVKPKQKGCVSLVANVPMHSN